MLSRRQFLQGAALVVAAAVAGRRTRRPAAPAAVPVEARGDAPFRIALLCDTHIQTDRPGAAATSGKLSQAVADLKRVRPQLWVVNGDVSEHGTPAEFDAFKRIMASVCRSDQLAVTTGNHEFYDRTATDADALLYFRHAFGLTRPYSNRLAGGLHVILLGGESGKSAPRNRDWAWLSAEQLAWFRGVLAEHRSTPTVVCLHQPLQDTVLWSTGNNSFAGCGQVNALRAILAENPQVKLWLSGHTHIGLAEPGQVVTQKGVTFAALGATAYQFVASDAPEDQGGWPGPGGFRKDPTANQSRLLEVWPDRLELHVRDHRQQLFLPHLTVSIPLNG